MLAAVVRVFLVLVAWCLAASRPTPTVAHAPHPTQLGVAKATIEVAAPVGASYRPSAQPPLTAAVVEPFSIHAPARRALPAARVHISRSTPPGAVGHFARGPPA